MKDYDPKDAEITPVKLETSIRGLEGYFLFMPYETDLDNSTYRDFISLRDEAYKGYDNLSGLVTADKFKAEGYISDLYALKSKYERMK